MGKRVLGSEVQGSEVRRFQINLERRTQNLGTYTKQLFLYNKTYLEVI